MKRVKIQYIVFWIIVALAALGILKNVFSPTFLIPLFVVGVVYLLYKFPPTRFRKPKRPKIKPSKRTAAKMAARSTSNRKSSHSSSKQKQYPFQVIEGQKGKNDPSDDLPKYH